MTSTGRDDAATGNEEIRDRNRLVEQSSGIAAQVEDQALQGLALFAFGLKDLLAQRLGRALVEAGDPQIADVAFGPIDHGLRHDVCAVQVERQVSRHRRPHDGQRHGGPDRAPQTPHDPVLGQAHRALAVDLGDQIQSPEPGGVGRRVLHDRKDLDALVDHPNAHADTAESVSTGPVFAGAFAPGIAGEIVELIDHAAEHGFVDRLGFRRLQRLRPVTQFLDDGRRQPAPAVGVVGMRGVEPTGRPAVDIECHQLVAIGDAQGRIEIRKPVETGQGEFGSSEILDIDVDHVLIAGTEDPGSAIDIVVARRVIVLKGAAEQQEEQRKRDRRARQPGHDPAPRCWRKA
jgi:hypothetical protein